MYICICVRACVYLCARVFVSVCEYLCVCMCVIWGWRRAHNVHTDTKHTRQHLQTRSSCHKTTTRDTPLPTPQYTTLLVHRAPQFIADPAPNPLLGHHITQSHVQFSERVHAAQTRRNGAAELIGAEGPDATARGASLVVVWCTAMTHACLGC